MDEKLEKKLFEDFPVIYGQHTWGFQNSCMGFGFECSDGWFDLIYKLSKDIQEVIDRTPALKGKKANWWYHVKQTVWKLKGLITLSLIFQHSKKEQLYFKNRLSNLFTLDEYEWDGMPFQATQVKSKFGGLRYYTTFVTDEIDALITKAEDDSYSICEYCGKPGTSNTSGWITTLCRKCRKQEVSLRKGWPKSVSK